MSIVKGSDKRRRVYVTQKRKLIPVGWLAKGKVKVDEDASFGETGSFHINPKCSAGKGGFDVCKARTAYIRENENWVKIGILGSRCKRFANNEQVEEIMSPSHYRKFV